MQIEAWLAFDGRIIFRKRDDETREDVSKNNKFVTFLGFTELLLTDLEGNHLNG